MNAFFSALQFITILPVGKNRPYDAVGMIPFFPLVGLLIGVMLAGFDAMAMTLWPKDVVAVLDVIFLIVVTGAFHLDGLGDTADGLFSHQSKERALEIMKDSRVGAMGLVAIICGLSLKWAGISSLPGPGWDRAMMLVIVPAFARSSILFGIRFLEYGRSQGTGKAHFDEALTLKGFRWVLIPVGLSLFLGFKGLLVNLIFVLVVLAMVSFYKRKMGCITGDMLGAMVEVTESLLFLCLACG
ncbi:MAG: adenosylcobinamide-GDP ribazoletransferase [Proteobacteria bacterium]|nr:adenosylcobinamide-GDP ribazoletransferase [Pseudomonadota bacterium]